jgi:aminopeptidase
MTDERIEKLAKLSVDYSVEVKPKDKVIIQGVDQAYPLINELYKRCLQKDAYPIILPNLDVQYTFFKHAKEHQLTFVSPLERTIAETFDIAISVHCEVNPKRLNNIDPAKMRMRAAARKELSEIFYKRVAEGKLRWTALPFPNMAGAQEASMALQEYEDFVYDSCLLNKPNPVAEWKKISRQQEGICKFLNKASQFHVKGEDTDLTFNAKGRKWINSQGKENMPDGEIFTAPIENTANGTIRFTYPGVHLGREVEDIKLTFSKGRVTKASAAKGEDFLHQILKVEGADRIGELAIGTNYGITRFTKNMLFDEKMGGTIHMALGNAYPESGGVNKSPIHWDILKDMKKDAEIIADGKSIYKNGKFLI